MQLLPNAKAQFIDSGGQPLANGTVGFYFPGTLNPKATFQDAAGTIANTNPVQLDSRGQALIWGTGVYRQILKDASGVTIWDQTTEDPNSGLTGSMTDAVFVAGTDFAPGTTTQLTLPAGPGAIANTWIFFDATYQDDAQASVVGTTLTFASPIPIGVGKVTVKIGSTIAIGTPNNGTVTDASIASGTKLSNRLSDWVDVNDFPGVDKTGTNDSTAGMQLAHNTGKVIYYPAGTYKFTTITMAAGGIVGDGPAQTRLQSTDASANDVILWNGAGGNPLDSTKASPRFSNFYLTTTGTKTGGSLINLAPSSGEISFSNFDNITFFGGWIQIGTVAASHWKITRCNFLNAIQCGVLVQNTNNPDSGDSVIDSCLFNFGNVATVSDQSGIIQFSSGGLRVNNCKFLGGDYGYTMEAKLPSNVGDLIFTNNSVEAAILSGLRFVRNSGTGGWGSIVIVGNEFGVNLVNNIVMNDSSGFLSDITIVGNTFNHIATGGNGIVIDFNTQILIDGNRFQGPASAGGAIVTGSSLTSLHIGVNQYNGGIAPVGIGTPSQTTIDLIGQSGTGSATTNTGYGTLFIGSVSITFPAAFQIAPTKFGAVPTSTGASAVSCLVTNVTTTGMTVSVIGVSNAANIPFEWFAESIA